MIEMSELDKLQHLGLISKICAELDNHLGFSDKTLAEYIIHLGSQHKNNHKSFHKALYDNGAEFPESFTENLLRIIMRLTGQAAAVKAKEAVSVVPIAPRSAADVKYPGLARPNSNPIPLEDMATEQIVSLIAEKPKPKENTEWTKESERSRDSDRREGRGIFATSRRERSATRSNSRDRRRSDTSSRKRDNSPSRRDRSNDRGRDRESDNHRGRNDRDRGRDDNYGRDERDRGRNDDRNRERDKDDNRGRNDNRDMNGGRDRNDREDNRSAKRPKAAPTEPELYGIYDGKVSNILDFGCFVELDHFNRKEGLVHIAQIQQGMVRDAKQVVKRGQKVKVKIISMVGSKMALSMKEVDQETGEDLLPQRSRETLAKMNSDLTNPSRPNGREGLGVMDLGVDIKKLRAQEDEDESTVRRSRKQLSSPELFEARQLISAGVLQVSEYPTFDAESGMGMLQSFEVEEEVEVEINEEEPSFLKGQTKMSRELSPVRIVKNPDGSMQRAALHQNQLSKERRDLKQAQANNLIDSIPKDLSKPWEDPMPEQGERHFAQELRSINVGGSYELPEWKAKTQGKGLAFGQISSKPLREQRESLPIFRLKAELCRAIAENQVLVVIGETGSGAQLYLYFYHVIIHPYSYAFYSDCMPYGVLELRLWGMFT